MKRNFKEDSKVLLRDVSVLKRDYQNLKERVEKLESHLLRTRTPKKTVMPLDSDCRRHNDDDGKHGTHSDDVRPCDSDHMHRRQNDDGQHGTHSDDIRPRDIDHMHRRQNDDGQNGTHSDNVRPHDSDHIHRRQNDDGQHGTHSNDVRPHDCDHMYRRQNDGDQQHDPGHKQICWQHNCGRSGHADYYRHHGTGYRWKDAESDTLPYDDYYPTDESWLNDEDQYNYVRDPREIQHYSNHSISDCSTSTSYGRDHGSGYTHYVSKSSTDYYRMGTQSEKQPIVENWPSTSSDHENLQSTLLLLKNSSYLESLKLRSSSIVLRYFQRRSE